MTRLRVPDEIRWVSCCSSQTIYFTVLEVTMLWFTKALVKVQIFHTTTEIFESAAVFLQLDLSWSTLKRVLQRSVWYGQRRKNVDHGSRI